MISLNIRHWKLGQLVSVSAAYWAVLAAASLAPFSRVVFTVARLGANRGTATASLNDNIITLTALKDGVAVYTGSASILEIALWIALPPLGLWLAWLASRPSRARAEELRAQQAHDALPDAARNGAAAYRAQSRGAEPIARRDAQR
jgi:hypothetical protein